MLPKLQIGGGAGRRTGGRGLQLPAYGADGGAEQAIDEDDLTVRKPVRLDAREKIIRDAGCAFKRATHKYETVIRGGIADLREIRAAAQRACGAIFEKRRARAPHEIDVALDKTAGEIGLTVDLDRILKAVEIDVLDDRARDATSVDDERLGLRAALRRGVMEREVGEGEIVHAVREEHPAPINIAAALRGFGAGIGRAAGEGIAAGAVEFGVVGISEDRRATVFAEDRDAVFVGEKDDLTIRAFADEDRDRGGVARGDVIERGLHGGKIAGAIGRDDETRGARDGRDGLGREAPCAGRLERGGDFVGNFKRTGVGGDVVAVAVGERTWRREQGDFALGDENGVIVVMIEPADGLGGDGRGDVERGDDGVRGRIVDAELAGSTEDRWGGKHETQRGVGVNRRCAVGGEKMCGGKAGARGRREADSHENDDEKKAGHRATGIFETENGRGGQKKAARWIPRG